MENIIILYLVMSAFMIIILSFLLYKSSKQLIKEKEEYKNLWIEYLSLYSTLNKNYDKNEGKDDEEN